MKKTVIIILIVLIIVLGIVLYFYFNNLNNKKEISTSIGLEDEQFQQRVSRNLEGTDEKPETIIVVLNEQGEIVEEIKDETVDSDEQEENNNLNEQTVQEENNTNLEVTSYYIKVNYKANVVTIYTPNENGEYVNPYKVMVCSTGTATPTEGEYKLSNKFSWLGLVGGVYGQYCTQITGNILFHSVPYTEKGNKASLEYWEYDKLGTACSAGCVRLTVSDAKWIYDNCNSGTIVEFYRSDEPGPLGKPEAIKISEYTEYRGWDPTDEDSNNPWISFSEI